MITGIICPYCQAEMRLVAGNPCFTYWACHKCQKGFAYNVITEEFDEEYKLNNEKEK